MLDNANAIPPQALSQTLAHTTTGKHILAEFWQCQCRPELLTKTQPLLNLLIDAIGQAGLTLVGQATHEFGTAFATCTDNTMGDSAINDNTMSETGEQVSGVTLSLLLAESHLCVHTWGEYQTVTLDIYVCNVANDNSSKADAIFDACLQLFKPKTHNVQTILRQHASIAT